MRAGRCGCGGAQVEHEETAEDAAGGAGDAASRLDISILPFIRQCKIADPHWFLDQNFRKVIDLLHYFESSSLFYIAMEKFDEWNPAKPKVVIFPSKRLS